MSFRVWATGFKVEYLKMKGIIEGLGLAGDGVGRFDTSVYKGPEQLLNCVGCCKGSQRGKKGRVVTDERILTMSCGSVQLVAYGVLVVVVEVEENGERAKKR